MAEEMLHAKGMKVKLSSGWWKLFRKRNLNPSLTQRKADMLCKPRMGATSRKVLDRYFDFLEEVLVHNGLAEKPAQIFNCDETGISLQHSTGQVVVPVQLITCKKTRTCTTKVQERMRETESIESPLHVYVAR